MAVTAQFLRLTRFFFTTTVSEERPEHISEREIESEPFAPRHLPRLYRTHFVLSTSVTRFGSLLRPRALHGGRTRNHALRPGGGYPKLPALDSTSAGTVVRLARGNQCSYTSGRMITACALHSVMCCTMCSTVTGGGKQYPRGTVFPLDVMATFG